MSIARFYLGAAPLLSLLLTACQGNVQGLLPDGALMSGPNGDGGTSAAAGSGSGSSNNMAGASAFDTSHCAAPPSRVVRLSKLELQNSIDDLLGKPSPVNLPDDAKFLNFSSNAEALVTPPFGDALQSAAQQLSDAFSGALDTTKLGADCAKTDDSARACAAGFIKTYGQKAFRRPLAQTDSDALLKVYDTGRETGAAGDFADRLKGGLGYVLQAILQSPDFVYRVELGDQSPAVSGVASLSAYEVASELSYMLTASPPDDALLQAAAENQLSTSDQLEQQARRVLDSGAERFALQESRFVREWLGINFTTPAWAKDPKIYPLYSDKLKQALDQETGLYIADWANQAPTLTALLTGTSSFINADNAPIYGLTAPAGAMTKVALDKTQRSGILTMPGFLGTRAHVDSSAPILRGSSIARMLMCLTIPPPPPNVPQLPPITDTSFTTTRDRVEKHIAASPTCSACHQHINPMGYALEEYDGLGVYRTTENGYPIDSSGAIVGTASSDQPVKNAIELAAALVKSPEVQDCFGQQVFRNMFGRESTPADGCALHDAAEAYKAKQLDTKELLVGLVKSKTFSQRAVSQVMP